MKFEFYSEKTHGVCVDGKWYATTPDSFIYAKRIPRGSEVTIQTEGEGKEEKLVRISLASGIEAPKAEFKPAISGGETEEKLRGVALRYAVDLHIASKCAKDEVFPISDAFYNYLKTGKMQSTDFNSEKP